MEEHLGIFSALTVIELLVFDPLIIEELCSGTKNAKVFKRTYETWVAVWSKLCRSFDPLRSQFVSKFGRSLVAVWSQFKSIHSQNTVNTNTL